MSKTIQLLNKDLLQRPSSERTYTTETINLADDDTPRDFTSNEEENELEVATTKSRQKEVKSSCVSCVTKTRRRRYKKKKRQQQRQSAFMSEEDEDEDEEGGNESDMSNEVFLNKKSVIEYFLHDFCCKWQYESKRHIYPLSLMKIINLKTLIRPKLYHQNIFLFSTYIMPV